MKYLKKFNESTDQTYEQVSRICELYEIENWSINDQGLVDINGNVNLSSRYLTELPLSFGKVTGNFYCNQNRLTTLEGSPRQVYKSFFCGDNKLTTLEGAPEKVGGYFICSDNDLGNLRGAPKEVGGHFFCTSNLLTTLEGAPRLVDGSFVCPGNKIYDFPFENGEFNWNDDLCFHYEDTQDPNTNPIQEIYELFGDSKDKFFQSLDHRYFKGGNKIDKRRFYRALEEFGIDAPSQLENYIWV